MGEATESLPKISIIRHHDMARREARLAVKEQLRAQRLKPQLMRVSEINRCAEIYFEEHARELLEVAWRKVQRSPDLMKFYTKEMKDRQRTLRLRAQNSQVTFRSEVR